MLVEWEFGTRPYGCAYDEITPHLTIGDHGPVGQMRAAEDVVGPFLPIHARAAELALFQGGPGMGRGPAVPIPLIASRPIHEARVGPARSA